MEYLATVPLATTPPLEISIYTKFTFQVMLKHRGKLGGRELVEIVIHPPSLRGSATAQSSHLSEHPILLAAEKQDVMDVGDGSVEVESRHKIGGRPYFVRESSLMSTVELLTNEGYLQLLQLDFPGGGGDAVVSGSWPFADGMFHLLGKPPFCSGNWRWFWEL